MIVVLDTNIVAGATYWRSKMAAVLLPFESERQSDSA
jgi:hypothetical protein